MGTKKGLKQNDATDLPVDINDSAQLQGLSVRLLAYATRRAKVKRWWLGGAGALAKGKMAEDVACEAILSLFGGPRRWEQTSQPDPWLHVKSVVNSILSNLVRAKENRVSNRDVEDDAASTQSTPESEMIAAEGEVWLEKRRALAHSLLQDEILAADDGTLLSLHDLIVRDDIHKPQELAQRLGTSVRDVNNLKKRFWRICRRVLDILEKEEGQTND
jgi:DNA-directed RNA polymerase specialized sigma24 family protein